MATRASVAQAGARAAVLALTGLLLLFGPARGADPTPDPVRRPAGAVADSLFAAATEQRAQDDYEAARATYLEIVSLVESDDALRPAHLANAYSELVDCQERLGEYAEALDTGRTILEVIEGDPAADPAFRADTMSHLGSNLVRLGRLDEARTWYERALATEGLREHDLGAESISRILLNLGGLERRAGSYEESRRHLEEALALRIATLEPADPAIAHAHRQLGNLSRTEGRYPEARRHYEEALRIQEATLGPHNLHTASTYNSYANLLTLLHEFDLATEYYERSLAARRARLTPEHPSLALALNNAANLQGMLGAYRDAVELYEEALEINRAAYGEMHPRVAENEYNLATVLRRMGRIPEAQVRAEDALSIYDDVLEPEHPRRADTWSLLAAIHRDLGDLEGSKRCLETALGIYRQRYGAGHPSAARAISELALLARAAGDLDEATRLSEQSLEVLRAAYGDDHLDVVQEMLSLGVLAIRQGDLDGAAARLEEAEAALRRTVTAPHPLEIDALELRATLAAKAGDPGEVERLYATALARQRKIHGAGHPREARLLRNRALLRRDRGEFDGAFADAIASEHVLREHARLTSRSTSEQEALRYHAVLRSGRDLVLTLISEASESNPDAAARALDSVVRSRSLVFDEVVSRNRTRNAHEEPELELQWRDYWRARSELANLVVRGPAGQPEDQWVEVLGYARKRKEDLERDLAGSSEAYRSDLARDRAGLSQVCGHLTPGDALVSFVVFDRVAADASPISADASRAAQTDYLAFVRRGDRDEVTAIPLGPAAIIDSIVGAWRREASEGEFRSDRAPAASERACRDTGWALRRAIWDPLAEQLEGTDRVWLVPDGSLHLVNLATLPDNGGTYLVESGALVHVLSGEKDLLTRERTGTGHGLLALGDPAYDEDAAPPARPPDGAVFRGVPGERLVDLRFERLPATREEVRGVVELWVARGLGSEDDVVELVGRVATEAAFKRHAGGKRHLHLATHGFFLDTGYPLPAAGPGILGPSDPWGSWSTLSRNPLLLSGLSLTGANVRREGEEEDGILTAEEIATLDLDGVECAVLSACRTALGPVVAGEGVFGLSRAFRIAGTSTVVLSLWEVEDRATRTWMRSFYEAQFGAGLTAAAAARSASLAQLEARRSAGMTTHPFHWGGFFAIGR